MTLSYHQKFRFMTQVTISLSTSLCIQCRMVYPPDRHSLASPRRRRARARPDRGGEVVDEAVAVPSRTPLLSTTTPITTTMPTLLMGTETPVEGMRATRTPVGGMRGMRTRTALMARTPVSPVALADTRVMRTPQRHIRPQLHIRLHRLHRPPPTPIHGVTVLSQGVNSPDRQIKSWNTKVIDT